MKTIFTFLRRTVFFVLMIFSLGFFALESEDHIGNKSDEQSLSFEYYVIPESSVNEFSSNKEEFGLFQGSNADSFDEEYWSQQETAVGVFEDVHSRQYIVESFKGENFVLKKELRNKAGEVVGDFWSSSGQYLEGRGVRPYAPSPWPCEDFGDCAEDGVSPYVPNPWPCDELGDCSGDGISSYVPRDYARGGVFHIHRGLYFE